MTLALIVAINHLGVIGKNNTLPWHLPADLQYFKAVTLNSCVIMGRKTYTSIGRPLPKRINIILTRDQTYHAPGCLIAHSLDQAITLGKEQNPHPSPLFIIGGADIYQQALPFCDKVYLTVVDNHEPGDVFFPESLDSLLQQGWHITHEETHPQNDQHAFACTWYQLSKEPKAC